MLKNIWMDGIMGVIVGDALGCPVEFMERRELKDNPVRDMREYGTFNLPKGSFTDDGSMTLATLASIREKQDIDLKDIMDRFSRWYDQGEYTPFGNAFDIGGGTESAILRYKRGYGIKECGGKTEHDNGNGSLMRIMPVCLYCYEKKPDDKEALELIHLVSGLTHNHMRAKIACGLYYFCVKAVLDGKGGLKDRLQEGLDAGFAFYESDISNRVELSYYGRLRDLGELSRTEEKEIRSSGYVVDTIEAAFWSLITTGSYKECGLKAVNLGEDTDTVAAIAGGIAGLYYGYEGIPEEWRSVIQRRDWIEGVIEDNTERS